MSVCVWFLINDKTKQRFSQKHIICKSITDFVGDDLVTNNATVVTEESVVSKKKGK